MMNVFEDARTRTDLRQVAVWLGLQPNNKGFVVCPFHREKTGSMLLNNNGWAYCFGCGWKGDVTDFVAGVRGVSKLEALGMINDAFALGLDLEGQHKQLRPARGSDTQTVTAEKLRQMVDAIGDLHRELFRTNINREFIDELDAFHQDLLEADDLRKQAPEVFYRLFRKDFERYAVAEDKYKRIREAIQRANTDGRDYPFQEVWAIMGRPGTIT